jgi:hypothetical protein
MMHAFLEAFGAALRCGEFFFLVAPAGALLACWFIGFQACRSIDRLFVSRNKNTVE